jgi:hypothetical protein
MARSEGLEPPTYKFVACCSIQLSYDRTQRATLRRVFLFPLWQPGAGFPKHRRGRDSNPRTVFDRRSFSKRLVSATHPPLRGRDHYTTRTPRVPSPLCYPLGGSSTTSGISGGCFRVALYSNASTPTTLPAGITIMKKESTNAAASSVPIVVHELNSPLSPM